jgi:hypothetical protein
MIFCKKTGSPQSILKLFIMVVLLLPILLSCGLNYSIDGKVVDADTGQPIEGAVVAVNWQRTQLGIPGLPVPREKYGTFESVTDATGAFTLPKFLIGHHYMAAYKKGYICWSSETIFKPEGKDWKEMFAPRHGHRVKNGMVLELAIETADFPEEKHAQFVQRVGTRLSSPKPMFNKSTQEVYELYMNDIKNRMKGNRK